MNKKQGSAMVLAILLLSFFMALSLNMWFISQKKSQRAGDIVLGNRVLTDIDAASTLGYYEFFLATEYMVNGFVTSPASYTLTSSSISYVTSTGALSTTYEGISLDNERQYFGAYIYTSGSALTTTANAILQEEEIVGGKLKSRTWDTNVSGAAIRELWEVGAYTTAESVGGYKISALSVSSTTAAITNSSEFLAEVKLSGEHTITTDYVKTIYFGSSVSAKNQDISYQVRVKRETKVTGTGSGYTITADGITNITVELQ